MTSQPSAVADLRHRIANPLAALLTEAQLALLDRDTLPDHAVECFERIERLALRMRDMLKERAPVATMNE